MICQGCILEIKETWGWSIYMRHREYQLMKITDHARQLFIFCYVRSVSLRLSCLICIYSNTTSKWDYCTKLYQKLVRYQVVFFKIPEQYQMHLRPHEYYLTDSTDWYRVSTISLLPSYGESLRLDPTSFEDIWLFFKSRYVQAAMWNHVVN